MTDIPRGQGGDGSPHLDLDAIEKWAEHVLCAMKLEMVWQRPFTDYRDDLPTHSVRSQMLALVALVRRLQQERAQVIANAMGQLSAKDAAIFELRGRVEELTEALRIEQDRSTMAFAHCAIAREELGEKRWKRVEDAVHAWPESARVVPEKET